MKKSVFFRSFILFAIIFGVTIITNRCYGAQASYNITENGSKYNIKIENAKGFITHLKYSNGGTPVYDSYVFIMKNSTTITLDINKLADDAVKAKKWEKSFADTVKESIDEFKESYKVSVDFLKTTSAKLELSKTFSKTYSINFKLAGTDQQVGPIDVLLDDDNREEGYERETKMISNAYTSKTLDKNNDFFELDLDLNSRGILDGYISAGRNTDLTPNSSNYSVDVSALRK